MYSSVAVATNNIFVGASTIYIDPMVGAFTVIAETEPRYGTNGLDELLLGKSVQQAIEATALNDENSFFRQVAGIDIDGNSHAFTGSSVKYWNGHSGHINGPNYIIIGNQLADSVLQRMAYTFESTDGSLSFKLLECLISGQINGGQITGKRSAALVVKGQNNEWYQQIDMRVDNSEDPIRDLQTIYYYQEGRIALNQAQFALAGGNIERARKKLEYAERILVGWDGMYSKIAAIHSVLNDDESAVRWINRGMLENASWKHNIAAFYYLKDHPRLKFTIDESRFSVADWENAVQMLVNLGRDNQARSLMDELLDQGLESSTLLLILAKIQIQSGQEILAKESLRKSLKLDSSNLEAQDFFDKIE